MNTANTSVKIKSSINHEVIIFIAVVLISSILFFFGTGLEPMFVLTWLAPMPIIWYLTVSQSTLPLIAGFLSYGLGSLNMYAYLLNHLPPLLIIGSILVQAFVYTCGLWLFVWGYKKNKNLSVFLFPCFWVSFEFIKSIVSQHGTFGSLAYTQAEFEAFTQWVSVTGIWGMTFFLMFIPTLFVLATKNIKLFIPLIILISLFTVANKADLDQQKTPTLNIGLMAADPFIQYFNQTEISAVQKVLTEYLENAEQLLEGTLDVLVLPEKIVTITEENKTTVKQMLQNFTAQNQLLLVIGLTVETQDHKKNVAWVFDEEQFIGEYVKQNLVPGWESDYTPGDKKLIFSKWGLKIGIAICKDMDFPELIREYADEGIDLMLVPAWDFDADAKLHNNMSTFRGIEGGFSIARSASQGLLSVSNSFGKNQILTDSDPQSVTSIKGQIKPIHIKTLHTDLGNWFALLVTALLLFFILILRFRY